ncbi:type II toxin-antitoxin system antitoxin DNA ADP-ribosyl glycohydrolase DarG [Paenibacillus sp. URB8-2]|uniref:type II toxin-antitoxin system antitoxin DNA ADP-ribosyl glycohydrolase DarG n=1 Tax=Paenibacillus sp. URB8-2 TaxID=2741301 RepID=UPI0015B9D9E3|nr:macro domain-containing protein [Paenibacillus sp. URB8-2]BCG58085.1 Appr-1-p processing protein [Paenibacillus sp. URB8-2]
MIEYKKGNLLEAEAEALINTVNCVGVMGKGIALQFKQAFPGNFKEYAKACKNNLVMPGKMFVVPTGYMLNPKYIINFPTKRHWKEKSKIEDIKSGLIDFIDTIKENGIKSVAVPPLGCGNGGLDWNQVKPLIEASAQEVPDVLFMVYPPEGSPEPDKMRVGTEKPKLTRARALLIMLMNLYAAPGYKLSMLEIQKLAYFLQESGEDLKLRFVSAQYGPYADNLNHVLQRLEGHFIRGYGDRNRDAQIYLLPEVVKEAEAFLNSIEDATSEQRLENTKRIIEGYETPYGLELLATTDWIIKHYPDARTDVSRAIDHFKAWNDRKKKVFKDSHIEMAWKHLTTASN